MRRSLAQTPPTFKQNETEDSTVIIDADQSFNKPTVTSLKEHNKQLRSMKNNSVQPNAKPTPKNVPKSSNNIVEAGVESRTYIILKTEASTKTETK